MLPSIQFILGNPAATGNPVACSGSEQEWEKHRRHFRMLEEETLALVQYFASLTNFFHLYEAVVLTGQQSFSHPFPSPEESTDAGLNQPPLWDNPTFPFTAMVAEGQVNEEYLLRKNANPMHEVAWLLMLHCDGLQESCGYHESCCLFRLGVRRREATSTLCHAACWKNKRFPWCVASFADLWDIPAAIFFTPVPSTKESANAGLNHRPLWDNDSRHSAYCCKRSDQWAICSAQSWCLNKLELGRRLGKPLALAFLWESRCLFGSELRIGPIVPAGTAHACPTLMSCLCCKLMGPSSSLRNINPEYQRECRHAGVNQWPFCDNRTRYSAHACLCRKKFGSMSASSLDRFVLGAGCNTYDWISLSLAKSLHPWAKHSALWCATLARGQMNEQCFLHNDGCEKLEFSQMPEKSVVGLCQEKLWLLCDVLCESCCYQALPWE